MAVSYNHRCASYILGFGFCRTITSASELSSIVWKLCHTQLCKVYNVSRELVVAVLLVLVDVLVEPGGLTNMLRLLTSLEVY